MFIGTLFFIFIIAVAWAFWSLRKQKNIEELKHVNRELKKKKVIYDYSSSEESASR